MIFQCIHDFSTTYGLPVGMLLMGLLGGFSHCTLMCGAFVVGQSGDDSSALTKLAGIPLLPYHMGRALTYVGLAGLFYSVLNLATLFLPVKNFVVVPLLLLAGVIFLASAFPLVARVFPWAAEVKLNLFPQVLERIVALSLNSMSPYKQFISGVLLGFMPCGMVVAALMATATAPTLSQSLMAMGLFAVGTIPALMCVSLGTAYVQKKWGRHFVTIRQSALLVSGLWIFALAGFMVF